MNESSYARHALLAAASLGASGAGAAPGLVVAQSTGASEDIRDIRGPKAMPGSWLLPVLIAGVVVATAVYLLWRPSRGASPRAAALTLSQQALRRLDAARPLMLPATAREFGIAASETVRSYIEKRFHVVATQRTTQEFLQSLLQTSNSALARHRSQLAEFLQQCDFVKFAGGSLAVSDMEALFQSARSFILLTDERTAA